MKEMKEVKEIKGRMQKMIDQAKAQGDGNYRITITYDDGRQGLIQLEIKGKRFTLSPLDNVGQYFYENWLALI